MKKLKVGRYFAAALILVGNLLWGLIVYYGIVEGVLKYWMLVGPVFLWIGIASFALKVAKVKLNITMAIVVWSSFSAMGMICAFLTWGWLALVIAFYNF
jgi:hypothetical protein